jgi:E3 ubiquitin-protein ligase SHPRH
VTPSSLATQWVDEIKTHAPSLKVLVYQGWQKVGVPITDADAQQLRKVRTARVRKKGKAPVRRESSVNSVNGWDQNMMEVDDSESDSDSDGDDTPGTTSWCSCVVSFSVICVYLTESRYLNTFDICVTTYDVLRNDLGVARAPPKRPRRQNVVYSEIKRSRSPLIMVEWHRVIMDEVQVRVVRSTFSP